MYINNCNAILQDAISGLRHLLHAVQREAQQASKQASKQASIKTYIHPTDEISTGKIPVNPFL